MSGEEHDSQISRRDAFWGAAGVLMGLLIIGVPGFLITGAEMSAGWVVGIVTMMLGMPLIYGGAEVVTERYGTADQWQVFGNGE